MPEGIRTVEDALSAGWTRNALYDALRPQAGRALKPVSTVKAAILAMLGKRVVYGRARTLFEPLTNLKHAEALMLFAVEHHDALAARMKPVPDAAVAPDVEQAA